MPITMLYAGALALVLLALSIRVIQRAGRKRSTWVTAATRWC